MRGGGHLEFGGVTLGQNLEGLSDPLAVGVVIEDGPPKRGKVGSITRRLTGPGSTERGETVRRKTGQSCLEKKKRVSYLDGGGMEASLFSKSKEVLRYGGMVMSLCTLKLWCCPTYHKVMCL